MLKEFFSGLDNLFAKKDLAGAEGYLAQHLENAKNCGDIRYQLAVLNEQAGYYRSLSRYAQSLEAGEQAMAIISAPDFTDNISAATTMLNVATALRAAGRIPDALDMYRKVDELYTATLDASDPRRAALYNNMAQAMMASGDKKTALEYLHESAAILETTRGACAELATTHSNIAVICMSIDDHESAESNLRIAMSIFESLDYDDAHYPAALAVMAQLLHIRGDYTGAIEQYRLALTKNEAVFGQNADYARICRNCAKAYSKLGILEKAEELVQKAQAVENKLNKG